LRRLAYDASAALFALRVSKLAGDTWLTFWTTACEAAKRDAIKANATKYSFLLSEIITHITNAVVSFELTSIQQSSYDDDLLLTIIAPFFTSRPRTFLLAARSRGQRLAAAGVVADNGLPDFRRPGAVKSHLDLTKLTSLAS